MVGFGSGRSLMLPSYPPAFLGIAPDRCGENLHIPSRHHTPHFAGASAPEFEPEGPAYDVCVASTSSLEGVGAEQLDEGWPPAHPMGTHDKPHHDCDQRCLERRRSVACSTTYQCHRPRQPRPPRSPTSAVSPRWVAQLLQKWVAR